MLNYWIYVGEIMGFQFLIGTVLHDEEYGVIEETPDVSIPYRYGITKKQNKFLQKKEKFQFLIGTVLHRKKRKRMKKKIKFQFLIGTVLQQYFRHFPALSSFFVSKLFKKSVDLTFLLSQIPLKNQAFFKKIFFRLGRQTFLHFFRFL